jgi:hypothetical protein
MLINRGLSIFDDFHNLPLVSRLAAGDFPPHFYLNPDQRLAYHYGLNLLAASLVRIGGFFPWSAFDLAKALSLALTLSLGYLWLHRMTRSQLAGALGAGVLLFAGGARWLLLFLPQTSLIQMGQGLQFLGSSAASGADLYSALSNPWKMVGGGPFPFPFAFINGIFTPLLFAIGGPGALPQMTLVLLLLLARRRWQAFPGMVFGLLLASLALSAEHLFALAWGGIFLAGLAGAILRRSGKSKLNWGWVLVPSAVLALLGGGVMTEIVRGWLAPATAAASASAGFAGFSLRWPPMVLSAHLGSLSIVQPGQLLIALAEIGPALLLGPWVTRQGLRQIGRGRYLTAGLAVGAAAGFIIPLFIRYGVERDISRLSGSALFIWTLCGFPFIWLTLRRYRPAGRMLVALGGVTAILGGVTLFTVELIAIPHPQFAFFVQGPDALISRRQWDRLAPEAHILDHIAYRAVTLFGRDAGPASEDLYTPLSGWQALMDDPDPARIAQAGYSYFYIDKNWWEKLKPEQRLALQQPCVQKVDETQVDSDFRWLLDVRACGVP